MHVCVCTWACKIFVCVCVWLWLNLPPIATNHCTYCPVSGIRILKVPEGWSRLGTTYVQINQTWHRSCVETYILCIFGVGVVKKIFTMTFFLWIRWWFVTHTEIRKSFSFLVVGTSYVTLRFVALPVHIVRMLLLSSMSGKRALMDRSVQLLKYRFH